jgi:hypothetical protein
MAGETNTVPYCSSGRHIIPAGFVVEGVRLRQPIEVIYTNWHGSCAGVYEIFTDKIIGRVDVVANTFGEDSTDNFACADYALMQTLVGRFVALGGHEKHQDIEKVDIPRLARLRELLEAA